MGHPAQPFIVADAAPLDRAHQSDTYESLLVGTGPVPETRFVGPFFSQPLNLDGSTTPEAIDRSVHDRLLDLFRGLTPRTVGRGAFYIWSQTSVRVPDRGEVGPASILDDVQLFVAQRGADVQFILDEVDVNADTITQMQSGSPATGRAATPVFVFHGDGIMHAKNLVFSELEFAEHVAPLYPRRMEHVVAVTTANMSSRQMHGPNNVVIMHGNRELHDTFLDLWNDRTLHPDARHPIRRTCGNVVVYSFPRSRPESTSTVAAILNPLGWLLDQLNFTIDSEIAAQLTGGLDVAEAANLLYGRLLDAADYDIVAEICLNLFENMLEGGPPPRVLVAHSFWSRQGPVIGLLLLKALGADVRVLMSGDYSGRVGTAIFAGNVWAGFLLSTLMPVKLLPNGGSGDGADMHNKYIVIDGQYSGHHHRFVWTGSHNLNASSLDMDVEVLVRIGDWDVIDAYEENFESLWVMGRDYDVAGEAAELGLTLFSEIEEGEWRPDEE
jgi:hypothetical protein